MSIRYQIGGATGMLRRLVRPNRRRRHERWNAVAPALLASFLALILVSAPQPAASQVFWTVETPDGKLGWLLGTIHTEDPRVLDFPPALQQALDDADRVALELVPDAAMLAALSEAMLLPRGERLSEVLSPALYADVLAVLDDYGLDAPAVERMRPWAVAMTLALPPPETGLFMDMALAFRAARLGAEVEALETLDEQLAFLTGLGREAHIEMLELAVADSDGGRALFEALIQAYLARDSERLRALAERELERMGPEIRARFEAEGIVARNRRMAERAAPLYDRGGTLVAVGALHLPGEYGLVELLRSRGYVVEPVY
ncbi:TraB/GumN family protein [Halomonas denitrificans]|nr:TraB/GumN family protein [Halomonas denitrificans]